MNSQLRVGFIGLGMMGKPMSKRVLAAGYPLTVCDIKPEPVSELVTAGAAQAPNPKEVAKTCDVVLTSLPSLDACEKVYLGPSGLLEGARAGQILLETSTVPPRLVKRFAEEARKRGVIVMDAALLARTTFHPGMSKMKADEIAAKGQVTVMVGGEHADIEKVRPILATFGDPIFDVGPVGSGEMIKVLSNATSHAYYLVACEILALAAKAGVNLRKLEEIFRNTSAKSAAMNDTIPYYLENRKGKLMNQEAALKDSDSILELTREFNVPLFIQNIKHSYFQMALQRTGSKDLPWDGEQMKLWESLIGRPIAFD